MAHMNESVIIRSADELAAALRARRVQLDLPLREVGERASMPLQQVHAAEMGLVKPGPSVLIRIAHALGYDLALIPRDDVHTERAAVSDPGVVTTEKEKPR